jgi:hypothetical protein
LNDGGSQGSLPRAGGSLQGQGASRSCKFDYWVDETIKWLERAINAHDQLIGPESDLGLQRLDQSDSM